MSTQLTYTRGNSAQTIVFDSCKRSYTFEAELTDSPQEKKAVQSDGAINKPSGAVLDCQITDHPLDGAARHNEPASEGRANRIFNELLRVKTEFLLCNLVGGPVALPQCRIQRIELDQTKPLVGTLAFKLTLREVLISELETVPEVTPSERPPQKKTDKGDKSTTDADGNTKNQSYAKKAKNAIVKFFQ